MLRLIGSGDIKVVVAEYLRRRDDLKGRLAIDLPAGDGQMSRVLAACGAQVESYDLHPEPCRRAGVDCHHADLTQVLPLPDEHADLVLCQEAIEHLPDPLHALGELNRILKPNGLLLLTTPNVSHLRAKLSHLLVESELYNRLPPTDADARWFDDGETPYWEHVFLIGAQRLRLLASLSGFRLETIRPTKVSWSSLLLGLGYPLIVGTNLWAYWRGRKRRPSLDAAADREILRLNLNPTILFGKHLFWELRKR